MLPRGSLGMMDDCPFLFSSLLQIHSHPRTFAWSILVSPAALQLAPFCCRSQLTCLPQS